VSEDPGVRELSIRGPEALLLGDDPGLAAVDAVVAVLLRPGPSGWEVLLCRRAERLGDPWSGHISLPGGRVEPADREPADTARRETIEEVGLDPLGPGRLVGCFGPLSSGALVLRRRSVAVAVFAVEPDSVAVTSDEIVESWWTPWLDLETVEVPIAALGTSRPAFELVSPAGGTAIVWGLTHTVLTVLEEAATPPARADDPAPDDS
jgi:8-oxo-dGTP pyrophosphatase MutT (NUDIX family)